MITATEVVEQIRKMSVGLKALQRRDAALLRTEEEMAGFFEQVSPLTQAGWTRPEPDWPRPVVVHHVTDECVFAVLPAEDGARLQLMLVGLDRQEDPCFDTADAILDYVAEIEKALALLPAEELVDLIS